MQRSPAGDEGGRRQGARSPRRARLRRGRAAQRRLRPPRSRPSQRGRPRRAPGAGPEGPRPASAPPGAPAPPAGGLEVAGESPGGRAAPGGAAWFGEAGTRGWVEGVGCRVGTRLWLLVPFALGTRVALLTPSERTAAGGETLGVRRQGRVGCFVRGGGRGGMRETSTS